MNVGTQFSHFSQPKGIKVSHNLGLATTTVFFVSLLQVAYQRVRELIFKNLLFFSLNVSNILTWVLTCLSHRKAGKSACFLLAWSAMFSFSYRDVQRACVWVRDRSQLCFQCAGRWSQPSGQSSLIIK